MLLDTEQSELWNLKPSETTFYGLSFEIRL